MPQELEKYFMNEEHNLVICDTQWHIRSVSAGFLLFLGQGATQSTLMGQELGAVLQEHLGWECSFSQGAAATGVLVQTGEKGSTLVVRWNQLSCEKRSVYLVDIFSLSVQAVSDFCEKSNPDLDILLDSVHDGIWIIDGEGITRRVNKSMERIADIRKEEVVGRHVAEAMELKKFSACVTLHALQEKRPVTMFDDYANGRRCLNTSTPIMDEDGEVVRVIAVIRDITEFDEMHRKLTELERANEAYKNRLLSIDDEEMLGIVGGSLVARQFRLQLQKAARTDAPSLLLGATGTGKSLAAKAIHEMSSRKEAPFISVNCGGIPATLIESELFGYEKGAFTGALRSGKRGVFEMAQEGTLFLDEIAELPLSVQGTLLHVLDELPFRRVGGTSSIQTDVRIIAATNKDLEAMVAQGEFREDLFYRLRVMVIQIPSLKERSEDIPDIARYLLQVLEGTQSTKALSPPVMSLLMSYGWPGNVRELRAVLRYMLATSEHEAFRVEDLPPYLLAAMPAGRAIAPSSKSLRRAVEDLEKSMLTTALQETGSTYKAAKLLKVSQSTIVRKAQRYKIGLIALEHDSHATKKK